ncbi:MAG: STAS domain-containing protein [Saprospiraceae bacterium]
MTHTISEHNATQIVEVHQLLSEFDNKLIFSDIQSHIEKGFDKLVIDLSNLDFMNSVGLNFLLQLLRNSGEKLTVASASDQVLKLLEVTKLKSRFKLSPTVAEALGK